jgi:hypothetical protein
MTGAFSGPAWFNGDMGDPAVAVLATDPGAKVLVFIDGQNLYKTCRSLFGHPLCHPHLLAQHLVGGRRHIECRFYTGRPNANIDPKQSLERLIARSIRLEAAVPVPDGQKQPKILPRFSYTHQITRRVFQRIRDDTDYTVDGSAWAAPQVPGTITSGNVVLKMD